jgi:hypothetical protein
MPSAVTLEDIQDALYLFGVRDKAKASRILRMVERYAETRNPVLVPRSSDPYYYLGMGESDMAQKKARCATCGKVKDWSLYPLMKTSPTKHSDVCKLCRDEGRPSLAAVPPGLELCCHGCKEMKKASTHFIRHASSKTGFGHYCQECRDAGVTPAPRVRARRKPSAGTG